MLYHVYKMHLSDADSDIINSHGFDASPRSKAYTAMMFADAEDNQLPINVMSAALLGLYQHGLTVEAPTIDAVFQYDNGAPRSMVANVHPVYHCRGLRSLSVGDVVVSKNGVSVCCSFGWASMPTQVALAFADMAKRIACQRPNALPSAA
jgi:hypothetical protein